MRHCAKPLLFILLLTAAACGPSEQEIRSYEAWAAARGAERNKISVTLINPKEPVTFKVHLNRADRLGAAEYGLNTMAPGIGRFMIMKWRNEFPDKKIRLEFFNDQGVNVTTMEE